MALTYIMIHGERCVTLAGLAEVYEVEWSFVVEAYEFGLLGTGVEADADARPEAGAGRRFGSSGRDARLERMAVAAEMLDRMATICRWHRQAGLDLAGIALLLEPELD